MVILLKNYELFQKALLIEKLIFSGFINIRPAPVYKPQIVVLHVQLVGHHC